jgi:hypothetical protein
VVEVRVAHEDVVDLGELLEGEVAHARARVDQHVVVDQKGRGAKAATDASAAPQHPDLHRLSHGHGGRLATAFRALALTPMENGLSVHYRHKQSWVLWSIPQFTGLARAPADPVAGPPGAR